MRVLEDENFGNADIIVFSLAYFHPSFEARCTVAAFLTTFLGFDALVVVDRASELGAMPIPGLCGECVF
jgi:hypothetical protein